MGHVSHGQCHLLPIRIAKKKEDNKVKKGDGTPENREAAFEVYAFFGGSGIKRILNRLEAMHGLDISERTLYEWKEEGGWDLRLGGRKDSERITFRERMFLKVMDHIERYEKKFSENPSATDNQASYAYTNLLRTALELSGSMRHWESRDPETLRTSGFPRQIGSISEESEAETTINQEVAVSPSPSP